MKMRNQYTCPLEFTHDITKGKWKPMILWQLAKGPASLSQLVRDIQGITQKVLLEHLSDLIEFNIVEKTSFEGYPLKVEYRLSERGKKLYEAVEIMQNVGIQLMQEHGMEDFLKRQGFIE